MREVQRHGLLGKSDACVGFESRSSLATAVEVLAKQYTTNDEAVAGIASDINNYYRTTYPDVYSSKTSSIGAAVAEVQRIYQTYFFPEMKTDWQAHPNNIGHYNAQGCFRCHDGQHSTKSGDSITQDCGACHELVATDEQNPKILKDLGIQ